MDEKPILNEALRDLGDALGVDLDALVLKHIQAGLTLDTIAKILMGAAMDTMSLHMQTAVLQFGEALAERLGVKPDA